MSPIDRATLEWAYRVTLGFSAEDDVMVSRSLQVITTHDRTTLDPSGSAHDALIVALAQAMQLHLGGVQFGQLRHDLVAAGMREEAANSVHDHLVDVSVEEWERLEDRVRWYADDNDSPIAVSSTEKGDS